MKKEFILSEIRRTAKANGGRPLGMLRFQTEAGIRVGEWRGKYWPRWSAAVAEAGLEPNKVSSASAEEHLLGSLAIFTRELGRIPTDPELRLKRRRDPSFPSASGLRRFGKRADLIAALCAFCKAKPGDYQDVAALCMENAELPQGMPSEEDPLVGGYVYLVKSGRYFKIGRTNSVGRRIYELGIQLPERPKLVHEISTDDPEGIEQYWHRRFADKRKGGEWFTLSASDVDAFKRRKFM